MPKSDPNSPPPHNTKAALDDAAARISDIALRKKKNADAQAAFRARRANYIATLEETVTSLESVVLQLQDSCREARKESQELRQQNARLRHELREREKILRTLWVARKNGQGIDNDAPPPFPPSFTPDLVQESSGPALPQYGPAGIGYRTHSHSSSTASSAYSAISSPFQNNAASPPYPGMDAEISCDTASNRGAKFSPYQYTLQGVREGAWPQTIAQSASSSGDSGAVASNHSSHSPGFADSPPLDSSSMTYRFQVEDQKTPLATLEAAPYVFSNSRSLSPVNSTPGSSSSTSLTSFQFTFPDTAGSERSDFSFRRHTQSRGTDLTLHGGTADISVAGPSSDTVRYRIGRKGSPSLDRSIFPALPPLSTPDVGPSLERGSSDGDSACYPNLRMRPRRSITMARSSRSPSPGTPAISGTLAVIKAQAFGALRRTRARTKKTSEGAAKVAMDILEARGIEMGISPGTKRPRIQDDDHDATSTQS